MTDSLASMRARVAAHYKWAKTTDRPAATAAGRAAAASRFERDVDPEGKLPPTVRAQMADSARKAHFTRLALLSAKARRRRATQAGRPGHPTQVAEAAEWD